MKLTWNKINSQAKKVVKATCISSDLCSMTYKVTCIYDNVGNLSIYFNLLFSTYLPNFTDLKERKKLPPPERPPERAKGSRNTVAISAC